MTLKPLLIMIPLSVMLQASLLDFKWLQDAKEAYQEGNYTQALKTFQKVEKKSDALLYDQANSYYKEGNYTQAQKLYAQIQDPKLAFKKWHNLGNSYAQLGKLDEGINAYEEALKIKEDKDTQFNLELLKKKKKEQEQKKKDQQNKDQKQNDKNKQDQQNKDQKQNDKNKQDQQNKDQKQNDKNKQDKEQKDQQKRKEQDEKERQKQQAHAMQQAKKEPISDKEMRKYQKMLDQRGINTLMLPITNKGEKNEEIKPW